MKINSENLYELINDGVIKANTKIKVYSNDIYRTTITFDGYDFIWETGTFSSGMLFNPLCDFEIIEEEKEIEETDFTFDNTIWETEYQTANDIEQKLINQNCILKNKLDELVREFNKLKKDK